MAAQYRAECPCGWAGVTWYSQINAEDDIVRHNQRHRGGYSRAYVVVDESAPATESDYEKILD